MTRRDPATRRAWSAWIVTGVALVLGLLGLLVAFEDLVRPQRATSSWIVALDLFTAVTGVAGALGYGLGRRWGTYVFGASVVGHFVAHAELIVRAIHSNRVSVPLVGGLAVVPLVACMVWIAMARELGRRTPPP